MDHQTPEEFLDSVEGEISFFRSVMRARPVGLHKHFHVLAIRSAIRSDTGRVVPVDNIWAKLRTCYDLEALEGAETEGFDTPGSSQSSSPHAIRSPSPSENLSRHPFFRDEFSLPVDEALESLVAARRMRATASIPSSTPAPSPRQPAKTRRSKAPKTEHQEQSGHGCDSSALTQESGDEVAVTPRDSVVTGTDDPQETSPASGQSKAVRGGRGSKPRGGAAGRARPGSTSLIRGGAKKRKK
ncbi:chromatin modification-related protein EAF7-domain-containing protein [Melanogaster broomeanus]|nr:chromatin modification-related protein EAF7-domain-containing protein [Melanogaster broomeanus]